MRRLSKDLICFADDNDYIYIIDIIARTYGTLPSEVTKLSWYELMICLKCVKSRTTRLQRVMKSQKKKGGLQPTINLYDFIDLI